MTTSALIGALSRRGPLLPTSLQGTVQPVGQSGGGFDLVFEDHFEGSSLDTSKWNYRTGTTSGYHSVQLAANVSVANSLCTIAVKQEIPQVSGKDYSGGGIISKIYFGIGYREIRCRLTSCRGWHEAFWSGCGDGLGTSDCIGLPSPVIREIDTFEHDDFYNDSVYDHTVTMNRHLEPVDPVEPFETFGPGTNDLDTEFHTYATWHKAGGVLEYYIDGVLKQTFEDPGHDEGRHHLWVSVISLANRIIVDADLPGTFDVDYVRFWDAAAAPPTGDYEGPTPLQSAKTGDALTSAGAVVIESQEPSA